MAVDVDGRRSPPVPAPADGDRGRPPRRCASPRSTPASTGRRPVCCARSWRPRVAGHVNPQIQNVLDIIRSDDPDVLLINEFDTGTDGDPATVRLFARLAGYPLLVHGAVEHRRPVGLRPRQQRHGRRRQRRVRLRCLPGPVRAGRASRGTRSTPRRCARSRRSAGPTCPARCCRSTRRPASRGTRPRSSPCCGCRRRATGTCPIDVGRGRDVHFLVSHPTPPVFDGPEDRNGRRNFDEIRFWADYITPGRDVALHLRRRRPARRARRRRVVRHRRRPELRPARRRLGAGRHPAAPRPPARQHDASTPPATAPSRPRPLQGGANLTHRSDPQFDTADFADTAPGQPARRLRPAVEGPAHRRRRACSGRRRAQPASELTGVFPFPSSDHRLVWVDVGAAADGGRARSHRPGRRRRSVAPMGKLPLLEVADRRLRRGRGGHGPLPPRG